jgi:hypothetical protein
MRSVTRYRCPERTVCNRRFAQNRAALALAAASFLGACSDLKPVAEFGKNAGAIAGYSDVSDDYVASLERQVRYGQTGAAVSEQEIALRKKQTGRTRERQSALKLYAQALGALAADDLVDYNKQIDALNKSLVDGKFATSADTKGYATAAKLVSSFVTDVYRRKKLEALITTYDPAVQKLCTGLNDFVEQYDRGLTAERVHFNRYVAGLAERSSQDQMGMADFVRTMGGNYDDQLQKKVDNAKAFSKGIQTFAQGHKDLANILDSFHSA